MLKVLILGNIFEMKKRNQNYKKPYKSRERRKTGSLIRDQKPIFVKVDNQTNKSIFIFRFIRGLFFLISVIVSLILVLD